MKLILPIIFLVCVHYHDIEAQNSGNTTLFKNISLSTADNTRQENRFAPEVKSYSVQTNPSKAIFNLLMEGEYGQVNSIELYNMLGLCIFNSQIHSTRQNLNGIPHGVYLLRFLTEDKIITEKITIGGVRSYVNRPAFVDIN